MLPMKYPSEQKIEKTIEKERRSIHVAAAAAAAVESVKLLAAAAAAGCGCGCCGVTTPIAAKTAHHCSVRATRLSISSTLSIGSASSAFAAFLSVSATTAAAPEFAAQATSLTASSCAALC